MRAVIIDPVNENAYSLVERDVPVPGRGEVLVRMCAASVNYRDYFVRNNPVTPYSGDARGRVPFSDGVGLVEAVGPDVDNLAVGDRVSPNFFPSWLAGLPTPEAMGVSLGGTVDGVLAEYAVFPAAALVVPPAHLTDEQAATLPCAALTAWTGLVKYGRIEKGQTVLVQGTGGVSIFALQFAKLLGARTIVTSSSDEKLERARELGADHLVNYRTASNWPKRVVELTEGRGADHVVEIGGEQTLLPTLDALGTGASISLVGVLTGFGGEIPNAIMRQKYLHVHPVYVESRATFAEMNDFIAETKLVPVVDRVVAMEEADATVTSLPLGGHFGKVAVKIAE